MPKLFTLGAHWNANLYGSNVTTEGNWNVRGKPTTLGKVKINNIFPKERFENCADQESNLNCIPCGELSLDHVFWIPVFSRDLTSNIWRISLTTSIWVDELTTSTASSCTSIWKNLRNTKFKLRPFFRRRFKRKNWNHRTIFRTRLGWTLIKAHFETWPPQ